VRNDVREVQHLLNSLGYEAGAADGIYGLQTRQAIQKFNQNNGFPDALPIVDAALLTHLRAQMELLELQRR
jgi:peptidoglycan hydrolase-like protein with peptidoglycan-binding domain